MLMTRQSVALLIVFSALILSSCTEKEKEVIKDAPSERVFNVKTVTAEEQNVFIEYRTVGYVESGRRVAVRPEVSGRVVKIFVEEGDRVSKGDPLLKIEDETYRLAVEEISSNLRQAEEDLENLRRIYERRKELYEKDLIGKEEFESAKTRYEVALARVQSLRSALERAKLNLERTTVRSDISGKVERRLVSVGDYVTPQVKVFEITDTEDLRFVFRIPQEVRSRIREGSEVKVEVNGRVLKGKVFYISPSADPSRLFTVKARIRGDVSPGTYGEVSFRYKKVRAVSLPEQAVQLSQRQSFVWAVRDSRAVKVPVEVVAHREGEVLVRGKIRDGTKVIVEGFMFLYEGARVSEK